MQSDGFFIKAIFDCLGWYPCHYRIGRYVLGNNSSCCYYRTLSNCYIFPTRNDHCIRTYPNVIFYGHDTILHVGLCHLVHVYSRYIIDMIATMYVNTRSKHYMVSYLYPSMSTLDN